MYMCDKKGEREGGRGREREREGERGREREREVGMMQHTCTCMSFALFNICLPIMSMHQIMTSPHIKLTS